MKIKIKNKNRINNTGTYDLSNLIAYSIDDGFTITQNYNETLDSSVIRISHLTSKIDIEPFDEVVMYDDSRFNTLYWCVDTYTCTQECIDTNNYLYTYTINLFSQTKLLEGIILPNLSITPLKTASKRSIWYYLQQYNNEYGAKVRVGSAWVNKWGFDSTIQTKFNTIECPELQWNAPTFREVLNDLMMVADCIPVLNNGVISFLDLTQTNNAITNFNYIQESQSSSDYVSEIKMNMQNALQTSINNVKDTITTTEYIPLTCDTYSLNSDNIEIKTKYPILNIRSIKLYLQVALLDPTTADSNTFINMDLTNLTKEQDAYNVLPVKRTVDPTHPQTESAWQYQNYCLYYKRGGNSVNGLTKTNKVAGLSSDKTLWELYRDYAEALWEEAGGEATLQPNYYSSYFLIDYETTATQTFSAGKSDYKENYRQIVDNQTNSWVDAYTQANLEYQKANRLGNKGVFINQRVLDSNYIKLADTYDDNIVYQVEYQVYDNHIETNANACKDYILRDYFTGINSKIRTWINAQDEAFEKNELIKYYCEFDYASHSEYITPTTNFAKYMLSSVDPSLYSTNKNIPLQNGIINNFVCNLLSKVMANSLVFKTGFETNSYAGKVANITESDVEIDSSTKIVKIATSVLTTAGGVPLTPASYVDSNYEQNTFNVYFITDLLHDIDPTSTTPISDINARAFLYNQLQLPKVVLGDYINNVKYNETITHRKDNKEIPAFTIQFEYCTTSRDIYFTKGFVNLQSAVNTDYPHQISAWVSDTYNYGSETLPSGSDPNATISVINSNDKTAIVRVATTTSIPAGKTIYLYETTNNNVLLAWKVKTAGTTQELYLNILKSRNKWVYDSNGIKQSEI